MMNVPRSRTETCLVTFLQCDLDYKHVHEIVAFMLKIALAKVFQCHCSESGKGVVNARLPNMASESADWFHISAA